MKELVVGTILTGSIRITFLESVLHSKRACKTVARARNIIFHLPFKTGKQCHCLVGNEYLSFRW